MTSPIAISAGNSAGPTRCAAIVGYDETTAMTAAPSASSSRPKTASLSFTRSAEL